MLAPSGSSTFGVGALGIPVSFVRELVEFGLVTVTKGESGDEISRTDVQIVHAAWELPRCADLLDAPSIPLEPVEKLLRRKGLRPTTYQDWMRIDAAESELGGRYGRRRTKIASWSELLGIARGRRTGTAIPRD